MSSIILLCNNNKYKALFVIAIQIRSFRKIRLHIKDNVHIKDSIVLECLKYRQRRRKLNIKNYKLIELQRRSIVNRCRNKWDTVGALAKKSRKTQRVMETLLINSRITIKHIRILIS